MSCGAEVVVKNVSHSFAVDSGDLVVLDDLSFQAAPGSYVSIMGPSGAGKSTLLSLLGGLEPAQSGSLQVGGHALGTMSRKALASYRCSTVGFVFQHFGLLDTLTAAENVAVPLLLAGKSRPEARRRSMELLDRVGLAERATHRPPALSGGERQRVAVARAIGNGPELLLADEPTGNLDEENGRMVIDLLESICTERACTVIAVTHDPRLAARADRRYRLKSGQLVVADS
jgi:predicted ABC-type transport system involved in lysophospholipase L1 biosynthesis ATPase subunit